MSIDRLQSKIRKMKCPIVLDFQMDVSLIPESILAEEKSFLKAFGRYAVELMDALRDVVPAVRFNFSEFAVCRHGHWFVSGHGHAGWRLHRRYGYPASGTEEILPDSGVRQPVGL